MLVKANVGFLNTDAGPKIVLSNVRVNSLPIPGFGGIVTGMATSVIEGMEMPADLVEMWSNIRRIELESGKMIVDVGLRRPAAEKS